MDRKRLLILLLGPVPIVTGAIALSRWAKPSPPADPNQNHAHVVMFADRSAAAEQAVAEAETPAGKPPSDDRHARNAEVDRRLATACQETAERLARKLGPACQVIARAPFVVAGDLAKAELERWARQTIEPAARAMARRYFAVAPSQPITVLLFRDEQSYNHYADQLFGDAQISVYGYYKPNLRTLVMNIGTGGGTLVHELTHALVDFDFPDAPDWFNEGLASLHEQCRIRRDESSIDGLENWRLHGLQETIRRGKLRSLEALIHDPEFRGAEVGLNYAQARYFCLFMQRGENPRGADVLAEFYARLRAGQRDDPHGAAAVRKTFPKQSWAELDAVFQRWVLALPAPEGK
ncbi:MAG TPA: hypothetical protein VMV10_10800 [Pirellulales bacterium]|nr:hypothetical protein [Pirellulales bacterium]